jgi:hypothetical protein
MEDKNAHKSFQSCKMLTCYQILSCHMFALGLNDNE